MSLRDVRARRHGILLDRIAAERARKGRISNRPKRVQTVRTVVVRESDDTAGGQPAVVCAVGFQPSLRPTGRLNAVDRIWHVSGPIVLAEGFGPESIDAAYGITINSIREGGE